MDNLLHNIFFYFSLVISFVILCLIPFRRKLILQKAGELIYSTSKKNILSSILIIVLSFALIVVLYFRNLGNFISAIIYCVAILAVTMSSNEIALSKYNGIYKNGIVGNGNFLAFSEIYAIPLLTCSKEEQEQDASSVIKFITNKKGNVSFGFSDSEEQKKVLKLIVELNPSFTRN